MADRDSILANFQACTGNEDFEECIAILEQSDWNLENAVQSAIGGNDSPLVSNSVSTEDLSMPSFEVPFPHSFLANNSNHTPLLRNYPQASCHSLFGSFPHRILKFTIEYEGQSPTISIGDNETVGRLRDLIQSTLGIDKSRIDLNCLEKRHQTLISDEIVLSDLQLPRDNLIPIPHSNLEKNEVFNRANSFMMDRLYQDFTLNITNADNNETYNLVFEGSRTVQEVKNKVCELTNIPINKQKWHGWPLNDDTMTLAGCNLKVPSHNLTVSVSVLPSSSHNSTTSTTHHNNEDVVQISDDEYVEDEYDDAMFMEEEEVPDSFNKMKPLMPDDIENETEGTKHFAEEFSRRYSDQSSFGCPLFFIGSLHEALKDSLQVRAADKKLLAIYLHHDQSILTHVFCSKVLCAETIVSYLTDNFIIWGWDLTRESNKSKLLSMVSSQFGRTASDQIRDFQLDHLPLILIISRTRSVNNVVSMVRANVNIDEIMTQLMQTVEEFTMQQGVEIKEESERDERERVKQEQDSAYEESLALDQAKEESKMAAMERIKIQEEEEQRQMMEASIKQKEEDQEKEAIRQSLIVHLPSEPTADCGKPIIAVRFRLPEGEVLTRRFLADDSLQILLHFLTTKGYPDRDYKILTSYPRRDLTSCSDRSQSLQKLNFCHQETLILEEKN